MKGCGKRSAPGFVAGFLLFALGFIPAGAKADNHDFLWLRTAGGSGAEVSRQIVVDDAGSSYIVGEFNSTNLPFGSIVLTNTLPSSLSTWDGFIVKYDSSGNVVWAKKFGGTNDDRGSSIAVDNQHNCYVTGWFDSTNFYIDGVTLTNYSPNGNSSLFVAKFDAAANLLWARGPSGGYNTSGSKIAVDSTGNCYVTGSFNGTNTFGGTNLVSRGSSDVLLLKYDPDGNLLWAQQAGGSALDGGAGIALDASNNVYLLANIRSTNAAFGSFVFSVIGTYICQNMVVAKYDPAGNVIWAKQYGGTSLDAGTSIVVDKSTNCYITGSASSTNLFFGSIVLTNNYNLLIGTAVFVVKLDDCGNALWAKAAQGNNTVSSQGIAVDQAGNSYIAGYFQCDYLVFDTMTLTNTEPDPFGGGPADAFVAKFDAYGNLLRVVQPVGTNDQRAFSIAVDSAANVYITGWTQGTNVLFGSFATTNAYLDMFVAKIDPDYPVLQIEPASDLGVSMPGGGVVVSWPINKTGYSGFTLESSPDLVTWGPAQLFENIIGGDRYYLVVEMSGDHNFYRLRLSN